MSIFTQKLLKAKNAIDTLTLQILPVYPINANFNLGLPLT